MKWSYKILTVYGIPLKLHITFPMLIIGYAALFGYQYGLKAAGIGAVLISFLFICVVLHELAHSRQAQKYGVTVKNVTLLPIGGVSNMEEMPETPKEELRIAIAGPLASFAIGIILLVVDFAVGYSIFDFNVERIATDIAYVPVYLGWINIFLAIFNLLPAFPMDGGRVVRAYLAERMTYMEATHVAATIGKVFAVIFGIVGLLINPILIFIAFFVYLGASSEEQSVAVGESLKGLKVKHVMNTECVTVDRDTPMSELLKKIFHGTCKGVVPVTDNEQYMGIATQDEMLSAIHEHGLDIEIGRIVNKTLPAVSPEDTLKDVYKKMQQQQKNAFPVMDNGKFVGVISLEDLGRAYSLMNAIKSGRD
ncbi:MAG: site-2 protease family protein [Candidatus Methanofastidiosia archaeon]